MTTWVAGMARDVGERFLGDPKARRGDLGGTLSVEVVGERTRS
jgi:hypothetical protein